jgi:hypothetical protein
MGWELSPKSKSKSRSFQRLAGLSPIVMIFTELVHDSAEPHGIDRLAQHNVAFILGVT